MNNQFVYHFNIFFIPNKYSFPLYFHFFGFFFYCYCLNWLNYRILLYILSCLWNIFFFFFYYKIFLLCTRFCICIHILYVILFYPHQLFSFSIIQFMLHHQRREIVNWCGIFPISLNLIIFYDYTYIYIGRYMFWLNSNPEIPHSIKVICTTYKPKYS